MFENVDRGTMEPLVYIIRIGKWPVRICHPSKVMFTSASPWWISLLGLTSP